MDSGVIIIEGNIGAGKSTFAQALAGRLGAEYIPEPAEGTNPYLESYYEAPARWAFEMQMFLLTSRFRAHRYACARAMHKSGFCVMDRSYYGDIAFAKVQRKLGYFSERDYKTYLMHHRDMQGFLPPPSYAIFLEADPAVCSKRIAKRASEIAGRQCESGIDIGYLQDLDSMIRTLCNDMRGTCPVSEIDYTRDRTAAEVEACADSVAAMIEAMAGADPSFWLAVNGAF